MARKRRKRERTVDEIIRSDASKLVHAPADQIAEGDNARRLYREIPELAAAVASQGLIHPLTVRDLRPGDDEADGADEPRYRLVSGYRRKRAIDLIRRTTPDLVEPDDAQRRLLELCDSERHAELLGPHRFEQIPCLLFEGSELDELLANLGENENRADLGVWELACRFATIRDRFGLSGRAIAQKRGYSAGYTNKVLRVHDGASPYLRKLLEAGAEHRSPNIFTTRRLLDVVRLPHAEQKKEIERWHGTGTETDETTPPPTATHRRLVSYPTAATALVEITDRAKTDPTWEKAEATLRWVMNLGPSPLQTDPEPVPEPESSP